MRAYIYILIMAVVTCAVRVIPLTLIRHRIQNGFLRSFLFYVPYVTLAVMTFPAIINVTRTPVSGAIALGAGVIAAWFNAGLFKVSVICCALVFISELFLIGGI